MDIFSLLGAANLLSTVSGGKGDILADVFGDNNPITAAKTKAIDTLRFFTQSALEEANMSGGVQQTENSDLSFTEQFLNTPFSIPKQAVENITSNEITQQLLAGTFDITKL